ncbi:MAG: ferrochelatase [Gammaproteobacteria bacterium]|nr:ferrochelatase [Gammaproteobacteria bacterium]
MYIGESEFRHDSSGSLGVLLTNLGTPDAPTTAAVRRYLAEFLWDPRVVETPRWLWALILHGVILRIRPRRSAALYREVWTDEGSPLLTISHRQREAVAAELTARRQGPVAVALGMRYGSPSIADALEELRGANVDRLLVLPLYPQYSATTTASTFDAVADVLKTRRRLPELRFVTHYHDRPDYIAALAASVRESFARHGEPDRLLFSFHGLPRRYLLAGDPYFCECQKTARLLATALGLVQERWAVSFQSRVGREEWLRPYTDELLKEWAAAGVGHVQVVCPGFSADCLETVEEIDQQNRAFFLGAGGETFHYIPALNDRPDHVAALTGLILDHLQGWPGQAVDAGQCARTRERAMALGASG